MKIKLFFGCLFLLISTAISQNSTSNFPTDFLGTYKGTLVINNSKGSRNIDMEFHLKKTDIENKFDYIIVYNKQPRNYTLVVTAKEKGTYNIDENNGIILPAKLHNNVLYSFFEVQGNFLSSRLAFKKDSLNFEILFSATKNKITTGGDATKKIPEVLGFPISTVQNAVLIKQKL